MRSAIIENNGGLEKLQIRRKVHAGLLKLYGTFRDPYCGPMLDRQDRVSHQHRRAQEYHPLLYKDLEMRSTLQEIYLTSGNARRSSGGIIRLTDISHLARSRRGGSSTYFRLI